MCSHEAAAVVEITPQKQGKEIIVAVYVNGDSNFVLRNFVLRGLATIAG